MFPYARHDRFQKMNAAMASSRGIRTNMRTPYRPNPIAALPRPNANIAANTVWQRQKNFGTSGLDRPDTKATQDPRLKYQQYVTLAVAKTQAGDLIAAENYYQHAEHYLRSMHGRAD